MPSAVLPSNGVDRDLFSQYPDDPQGDAVEPMKTGKLAMQVESTTGFSRLGRGKFGTILIDPPWRFLNRTGKVAPEHQRLRRYQTMSFEGIAALPVDDLALPKSHLYMWCPNALLPEAFPIMKAWGFTYKANIIWYKVRKDGGPDGRGVGFYFRNVTEVLLFGTRGQLRTLPPGRSQVNIISTRKQEHSRKPDEAYEIIEACSPGPYLEMFARQVAPGWKAWGDEAETYQSRRVEVRGYNSWSLRKSPALI